MNAYRKGWFVALCLSAAAVVTAPRAHAQIGIDINVAPPEPRVEVLPPPRPGFVWAPGYWDWRGHDHVWVAGRWVGERPGYHWAPDRWEQRGDHWHHVKGHWEH
jgi:hypothetical protein